jgi:hypothetical protein
MYRVALECGEKAGQTGVFTSLLTSPSLHRLAVPLASHHCCGGQASQRRTGHPGIHTVGSQGLVAQVIIMMTRSVGSEPLRVSSRMQVPVLVKSETSIRHGVMAGSDGPLQALAASSLPMCPP